MSEIERLKQQIQNLTAEELARFRAWFIEFDAEVWDRQIEGDVGAGKLDGTIGDALAEFKAGESREL